MYNQIKINQQISLNKNTEILTRLFDITIVSVSILLLLPVFVLNAILSLFLYTPVFKRQLETDALGRMVGKRQFNHGFLKHSAQLIDIFQGKYQLCGVSTKSRIEYYSQRELLKATSLKSGVFSSIDVNNAIGLSDHTNEHLLFQQAQFGFVGYVSLFIKSIICRLFFNAQKKKTTSIFNIFGLNINNDTMGEAVEKIVLHSPKTDEPPLSTFFINAHSVNLAQRNNEVKRILNQADLNYADGSGVRVAAQKKGVHLKANINGTDLLPELCQSCVDNSKSLFLFGAKPGIAKAASINLQKKFPLLKIAGVEHGYHNDDKSIIQSINDVKPDILLVALGSPQQEKWVLQNKEFLQCKSVLAVGGLFDFYSERISRAPRWMREIGMEWLYRLYQEPIAKFNRYVIGTPEFLIRTFLLNQVK